MLLRVLGSGTLLGVTLGTALGGVLCTFSGRFLTAPPTGSGGVHSFFSSPGSRFKFFKWSGSFALLKCPPSPFGLTSAFTRDVGGDLEL
jgi:hypothetical protein